MTILWVIVPATAIATSLLANIYAFKDTDGFAKELTTWKSLWYEQLAVALLLQVVQPAGAIYMAIAPNYRGSATTIAVCWATLAYHLGYSAMIVSLRRNQHCMQLSAVVCTGITTYVVATVASAAALAAGLVERNIPYNATSLFLFGCYLLLVVYGVGPDGIAFYQLLKSPQNDTTLNERRLLSAGFAMLMSIAFYAFVAMYDHMPEEAASLLQAKGVTHHAYGTVVACTSASIMLAWLPIAGQSTFTAKLLSIQL